MNDYLKQIKITEEEVKKLLTFQLSNTELADWCLKTADTDVDYEFVTDSEFHPEDLLEGLNRIARARRNDLVEQFISWVRLMSIYRDSIGMDPEDSKTSVEETIEDPKTEKALLKNLIIRLILIVENLTNPEGFETAEQRLKFLKTAVKEPASEIEYYYENQNLKPDEYKLTVPQKVEYVLKRTSAIDEGFETVTEGIRTWDYARELVEDDIEVGLRFAAYATYGDTKASECNWEICTACLKKLVEMYQDGTAANTLGYIYYYGRVNGGKPEYDKALKYFLIGHANFNMQSTYKLGDCMFYGHGVPVNESGALHLYEQVYHETFGRFEHGEATIFADAALRMGLAAKDGKGMKKNQVQAFQFLLQARFAANERRDEGRYGDEAVRANIDAAIREVGKELKEQGFIADNQAFIDVLTVIRNYLRYNDIIAELKIKRDGSFARFELSAHTVVNDEESDPFGEEETPEIECVNALLTIPELSLAKRVDKLVWYTEELTSLKVSASDSEEDEICLPVDWVEYSSCGMDFVLEGQKKVSVQTETGMFYMLREDYASETERPSFESDDGKVHTFATSGTCL